MRDWRKYWNRRPDDFDPADFVRQVERTTQRVPVSDQELDLVASEARNLLDLQPSDRLVDLCSGNGLITARFAEHCDVVAGVDFSERMVSIANEHFSRENLRYYAMSALEMDASQFAAGVPFTKVVVVESLQFFEPSQLPTLLDSIGTVSTDGARVVFTGVHDQERMWDFYDTPERKAEYHRRKAEGNEAVSHWWHRNEIAEVARERGLRCEFRAQRAELGTARYRFDAILEPE